MPRSKATCVPGMAEVYEHAMPGGQYTNLREQARAVGIDAWRWPEVAHAYAEVNKMFGDIVKVTPTSKVVGDMAIYMVTNELTPEEVLRPRSARSRSRIGRGAFPWRSRATPWRFPRSAAEEDPQGREPLTVRPGQVLDPIDLDVARAEAEKKVHRHIDDRELASYLMYPRVFTEYADHRRQYADVSALPTPAFFYGPEEGDELYHRRSSRANRL